MTEPTNFPYIVTFYSFKGGVGRSLALINVAFGLVKRGRNVLVLDMDLEAPGISGFLSRNDELAEPFGKDAIDMVGMAIEYAAQNPDATTYDTFFANVDGLEYAVPIAEKKLDHPSIKPRLGIQGKLDVIGVRQDEDKSFIDRLAALELGKKTGDQLQLAANALRAYFKTRRIAAPPLPGVDDIPGAENKPVPYDYVLVDSRTGVTDAGGLCIGPLSDRLVVLTGLNDQNVIGTRDFLKYIGLQPREWFSEKGDKPWDSAHKPSRDDPNSPRGLGPKPTLIVASPVPAEEIELRQRRLKAIEKEIGPVGAWIPYHPRLALFETFFVRDYPDEQVSFQYDKLTDLVLAGAMDHPMQLHRRWLDSKDRPTELSGLLRLAVANDTLGEGVLRDFAEAHDRKLSESDVNRLYAALTRTEATQRDISFNRWGNALLVQAQTSQGEEADRLFEQAYKKFQAALKIKPDKHEAINNWGTALSTQAKTKQGDQADRLFEKAYEKYQAALKINPDTHEAFSNWGAALSRQAEKKQGEQADRLFEQAYDKYLAAMKINPDMHEAFCNWGYALTAQAKTKQGDQADRLFEQAYEKYQAALKIKPNKHKAFCYWGASLTFQARTREGEEADRLFEQAYEKCQAALKIKLDDHVAFNNWGAALIYQARTRQGEKRMELLRKAQARLLEGERVKEGSCAFNLACTAALLGQVDDCRRWLQLALKHRELTPKLMEDSDLDPVRELPWFQEILAALG